MVSKYSSCSIFIIIAKSAKKVYKNRQCRKPSQEFTFAERNNFRKNICRKEILEKKIITE